MISSTSKAFTFNRGRRCLFLCRQRRREKKNNNKKKRQGGVGRFCAKESHTLASSIYFSSFRGCLCKINRAHTAAGSTAAGRGGGRGVVGQGALGAALGLPHLFQMRSQKTTVKKKRKKKKSLTSRAVFPGTSVINLRKRDTRLVRSQRLRVSWQSLGKI